MGTRLRRIALAGLVLGGLAISPEVDAAAVPAWTVIELEPLVDGDRVHVEDINDQGVSVGYSDDTWVKWDADGVPTALPNPVETECLRSYGITIADSGHIAASLVCDDVDDRLLVIWSPDGTVEALPGEEPTLLPEAVDDHGIVVGGASWWDPVDYDVHAFAYAEGHPTLWLPEAGATDGQATDLTSWGYVVGSLVGVPTLPEAVAVGWYGDQVFPLLGTTDDTLAVAVNAYGVALVREYDADDLNTRNHLVAPGGAVTTLDSRGDVDVVWDLNDAGIAVGSRQTDGVSEARFYVGDQSVALAETVSAEDAETFGLRSAVALNNHAWVVGNTPTGMSQGFAWLLKPPTQLPDTAASVTSR